MRLIDADLLKSYIIAACDGQISKRADILWDVINRQPTAYDVDKVLEQLDREKLKALRAYNEDKGTAYSYASSCRLDAYKKALKIVKVGGIDGQAKIKNVTRCSK